MSDGDASRMARRLSHSRRQVLMTVLSDQVARLLVELGERTPRIESIVQEADEPRWAIELDDGLVVLAEFDEDHKRLSLETDLGRPPEAHRLATCEALMMLTALEHASQDWAMGLSEPDGEFQLCGRVALVPSDPPDLESALLTFADQAAQWRDIVGQGAQSGGSSNEILMPTHMA